MKQLRGIAGLMAAVILAALAWSCGGADSFRILGTIEGLGTQNLQVVYFGDGAVRTMRSTAVDGKFSIEGRSRDYTVVDVFTSTRSLVASFIVKNGDHIECKLELNNPVAKEIKGSKPAVELMKWIGENEQALSGGQANAVNDAVRKYIGANSENVVSSVLLTRYFDARGREREADSLLRSILQKARIGWLTDGFRDGLVYNVDSVLPRLADSLWFVGTENRRIYADPGSRRATLLYFTSPDRTRQSGNDNLLRRTADEYKKDKRAVFFEIDDINGGAEGWQQTVTNDSLPWERVWNPAVSSTMALPARPWVIVADSLGQIQYSGQDLNGAVNKVRLLCL